MSPLSPIISVLLLVLKLYEGLLIIRILLTWFPAIPWYDQPFRTLRALTDPLLDLFRGLIPPIGMIDISPIVLFIALQLLEMLLRSLV